MNHPQAIHLLIQELKQSESYRNITQHDCNALNVELETGEYIRIYLWDDCPENRDIGAILTENTAQGLYTGCILSSTLINTPEELTFTLLHYIYGKVHAYHVLDESISILPVYLNWPESNQPLGMRFDIPVNLKKLRCHTLEKSYLHWTIAEFESVQFKPHRHSENNHGPHYTYRQSKTNGQSSQLYVTQEYYDLLGIKRTASKAEVKSAYRALAQVFHPDLNNSPNANDRMKSINEAYRQIMKK